MLRVTDDTTPRRRRWPTIAVAVLAAAALGLHGSKPKALAGPVVPAKFVEAKEKPPLDASFVIPTANADEVGVFAVRLGDLLRTPGLEKAAASYTGQMAVAFGGKKPLFELTDIEQVSGRVTISHNPKQAKPNRSLMLSLSMIRMSNDFDWAKQLQAWTTDWKEHAYGGSKMYSAKLTIPLLGFVDQTTWFYLPDGRTVVVESQENIKKLIDARGKPAAPAWADDWKTVQSGTFAMVIPDVKGKLANKVPTDEGDDEVGKQVLKAVAVVAGKANRASVGVEVGTGCSITVRLACASATDAADVDVGCQALAKLAEAAVAGPEPTEPLEKAGHKFSAMLVRGVEFTRAVDHVVEIRMRAEGGLTDVLKAVGAASK